jgi:protein-S-isoprenylcysteine O-methyltransferase Ste14
MTKLVLFAVLSAGLATLSWRFLRLRRTHGFYRFLAFECILALVLLNADRWFRDPFCPAQMVSWLLLLGSTVLAVHGFFLLVNVGKPARTARREEELGIEATTSLVTTGAYRYIRHPLYASLLCGGWGVFFKHVTLPSFLLAVAVSAFLTATAKVEELENLRKFGDGYAAYMKNTRMFVPWVV